MAKKAISARIDEDILTYIKGCHQPVNTLINTLLIKWMKNRQDKELLIWKEETGQDDLSQMKAKENFKCSQSCNNCIYIGKEKRNCLKTGIIFHPGDHININTFTCIYWEHKKKGSR